MREKIIQELALYQNGKWHQDKISDDIKLAVSIQYEFMTDEQLFDKLMEEIDDRINSIY